MIQQWKRKIVSFVKRGNEVMFLLDVFNRDVKKLFKPPSSQQRVVINVLGEQGVRILRQIPAITHIKKNYETIFPRMKC